MEKSQQGNDHGFFFFFFWNDQPSPYIHVDIEHIDYIIIGIWDLNIQ